MVFCGTGNKSIIKKSSRRVFVVLFASEKPLPGLVFSFYVSFAAVISIVLMLLWFGRFYIKLSSLFIIKHRLRTTFLDKVSFSWCNFHSNLYKVVIGWGNGLLPDKFTDTNVHHQGAVSIRKTVLPGMAIPMLKIRRPNGRLIFNMEIAIRR